MRAGSVDKQLGGNDGQDGEHQDAKMLVLGDNRAQWNHPEDHDQRCDQDRQGHPPEMGLDVHDRSGLPLNLHPARSLVRMIAG